MEKFCRLRVSSLAFLQCFSKLTRAKNKKENPNCPLVYRIAVRCTVKLRVLETASSEPASQFPTSAKKLKHQPASFQSQQETEIFCFAAFGGFLCPMRYIFMIWYKFVHCTNPFNGFPFFKLFYPPLWRRSWLARESSRPPPEVPTKSLVIKVRRRGVRRKEGSPAKRGTRRAVLETEDPQPASQFPISAKKLG